MSNRKEKNERKRENAILRSKQKTLVITLIDKQLEKISNGAIVFGLDHLRYIGNMISRLNDISNSDNTERAASIYDALLRQIQKASTDTNVEFSQFLKAILQLVRYELDTQI